MVMVDGQGTVVLVNQLTEQLFGYDRNELIGKSIRPIGSAEVRRQHCAEECILAHADNRA
jgi:PAS domain S-box-containing protein